MYLYFPFILGSIKRFQWVVTYSRFEMTSYQDGDSAAVCGSSCHQLRGVDYQVSMDTVRGSNLIVEVEDRLTADQWRGSFDAACETN